MSDDVRAHVEELEERVERLERILFYVFDVCFSDIEGAWGLETARELLKESQKLRRQIRLR